MTAVLPAAVGQGPAALWYLTRASGLVSLVLLTAVMVLGMVASVGWTAVRWPRFVSQAVHRNLALAAVAFIGLHVLTTVTDGYVPIGPMAAVVPLATPYRPLWVGFGALALDLLLVVAATSLLRHRIGAPAWRTVHWLAYLSWPVAVLHAAGTGSDTRHPVTLGIEVACVIAVVVTGLWRLAAGPAGSPVRRVGAAAAGVVAVGGIVAVAVTGPLRPGWSARAGTSPSVLAALDGGGAASPSPAAPAAPPAGAAGAPPVTPFSADLSGTFRSVPAGGGLVEVTLTLSVPGSPDPLVVALRGAPAGGGVDLSSGAVTWGAATGPVTALDGATVDAVVTGGGRTVDLAVTVRIDAAAGTAAGTVTGTAGSRS